MQSWEYIIEIMYILELKLNFEFKKGVGIAIKVKKQVASHLANSY